MEDQIKRVDAIIESAEIRSTLDQQDKMERLNQNKEQLLAYLRSNIIGNHDEYQVKTVYGEKPLFYADHTASGKALRCIEEYVTNEILPMYANTHTQQSGTGKQTNNAREEARTIIKRVCGANEDDALVFVGNGTTSAVNLLVAKLRIKEISERVAQVQDDESKTLDFNEVNFCKQNRWGSFDCVLCKTIMKSLGQYESHAQTEFHKRNVDIFKQNQQVWTERPVIFMSIYEHNSNVLPWREAGALIELVPLDQEGSLDFEAFEKLLQKYKGYNSLKVATMSAGSNITGTLVDVDRLAVLCHKYSTLAVFDYAAVAPYIGINMGGVTQDLVKHHGFKAIDPKDSGLAYKDAVFFSPHKLLGGPGSSGVLIAKKKVLFSRKPARSGGGIVFFVDELDHEYVQNVEELEESGTPGIISDIRAGLVFQLKEAISSDTIAEKEAKIHAKVMERLMSLGQNLFLLGNNQKAKVGIYSFLIRVKVGPSAWKFLNPPFVVSLLNDLFGIQSRSGCLCAGMYGQKILGIDLKLSREFKEALFDGNEVLRVGFTRLNLSYFLNEDDIDYVLSAIDFVARFGWIFLPHYQFEAETGIWINREEKESRVRTWLGQIDYSRGTMDYKSHANAQLKSHTPTSSFLKSRSKPLMEYLSDAQSTLVRVVENYKNLYGKSELDQSKLIGEGYQRLVWFAYPSDVLGELLSINTKGGLTFEQLETFNQQRGAITEANSIKLPFLPLDFNRGQKHKFAFSEEYLQATHHTQETSSSDEGEEQKVQEALGVVQKVIEDSKDEVNLKKQDYQEEEEEENGFMMFGEDITETTLPPAKQPRPKKQELLKVPKEILSQVGAAIRDFEMIKDGDRVLAALSWGKDSLALIHILRYFQSVAPINFTLGAVTVDPMVYEYNPAPLIPYLQGELGMPYFLERDAIVERAKTCMQKNSICAFCSRMKRGMIYNCARREGYNVIAMGQHLDDLAESFVMSAFHNGYLRTMKANYTIDKGDLRVIRPLVYCREALFKDFQQKVKLPVITDNCPACFSAPKERHRIKIMLAQQENLFPGLFQSILKTILPLMKSNMKDLLGFKSKGGEDSEDEAQEDMLAQPMAGSEESGCCPFIVPQ